MFIYYNKGKSIQWNGNNPSSLCICIFTSYILFTVILVACSLSCITKSRVNEISAVVLLISLCRICLFSTNTTATTQIFVYQPAHHIRWTKVARVRRSNIFYWMTRLMLGILTPNPARFVQINILVSPFIKSSSIFIFLSGSRSA